MLVSKINNKAQTPASRLSRPSDSAVFCARKQLTTDTLCLSNKPESKKISFKGLTRSIGKNILETPEEIMELVAKHPKPRGVVGNLPASWLAEIPEEDRGQEIKNVYKAFAQAANILEGLNSEDTANIKIVEAANIIKNSLKKAKVITDDKSFELSTLSKGLFGKTYKIKVNGEKFCLKVPRDIDELNPVERERRESIEKYNGITLEINRAAFWKKNAPNNHFVDFYFADIPNNYLVVKFAEEDDPFPNRYLLDSLFGVEVYDLVGNLIGGRIIDYGGQAVKIKELAQDKAARQRCRKIYRTISKAKRDQKAALWDKMFNSKWKTPAGDAAGLYYGAYRLTNEEKIQKLELLKERIQQTSGLENYWEKLTRVC